MNVITDYIKYLPATDDPLSADVYFIEGEKFCYIYDVGNNDIALRHINQIQKEKCIILSHYHKDHTGNIDRINYSNLYVGNKTFEVINKGKIIKDALTLYDGIKIEILPCISPHTEGSLVVTINNEYTLIADLFFTHPPFDKNIVSNMIDTLHKIDTKYLVVSHQEEKKIFLKHDFIAELSDYFIQ